MRKKARVQSAVGLRFDVSVGDAGRRAAELVLSSAFLQLTSWKCPAGADRTYARAVATGRGAVPEALGQLGARLGAACSSPPHVALAVRPHGSARALESLVRALAGPGAPAGIVDTAIFDRGLVLEFDVRRTPLAVVVATIDAAVGAGARTIEPLRPLEDDTLAAFAGALLGDPDITAARLIETHVDAFIASRR